MRHIVVTAIFEHVLDLFYHPAQFAGSIGVDFFHSMRFFTNDVVMIGPIEVNLVKGGAVVQETAADEAELLEYGKTAINRDKVT